MAAITVAADSELSRGTVGDLPGAVIAVEAADGAIEPIPARARTLAADETVYVVARPESLRELERRAGRADTAAARDA
ncbi:hypothetical protein [Halobaculum litoreum]|nr:hypothetical protein [Halobaculum sp. DT92]